MKIVRFAVGQNRVLSSNVWKAWADRKGDVYVLQRNSGTIHKFSLHASGICRWASNKPRSDGQDRVTMRWTRGAVPPKGEGKFVYLMSLIFPSSHLSMAHATNSAIVWIPSAPPKFATAVEFSLTAESEDHISMLLRNTPSRKLINFHELPHGHSWMITTTEFECGDVSLSVPAAPKMPGAVFGALEFPETDTTNSGRPVRMLISQPRAEHNPTFWELGGHRV